MRTLNLLKRAKVLVLGAPPTPSKPTQATQATKLEAVEAEMLDRPQVDCPVTHRFGPGLYLREIEMPAGAEVIGHEHKTQHWNVVLSGRARVLVGGEWRTIQAGDVFMSRAGSRKFGVIEETMRFLTLHPTDETNLDALESLLIRKSETFRAHEIVRDLDAAKPEASK